MHPSLYLIPAVLAAVLGSVNSYVARQEPKGLATGRYDNSTAWITQTVTAYQTYCPASTKFTKGTKTYTATAQTWVTVTDCPKLCTISNKAGAKPTVAPVGQISVWNNITSIAITKPASAPCPCETAAPSCPCAKPTAIPAPSSCPCSEVNGTQPATGGSCPCSSPGSYTSSTNLTSSTTSSGASAGTPSNPNSNSGSSGSSTSSSGAGAGTPSKSNSNADFSYQIASTGEKTSVSLSGLAIVALGFFAL